MCPTSPPPPNQPNTHPPLPPSISSPLSHPPSSIPPSGLLKAARPWCCWDHESPCRRLQGFAFDQLSLPKPGNPPDVGDWRLWPSCQAAVTGWAAAGAAEDIFPYSVCLLLQTQPHTQAGFYGFRWMGAVILLTYIYSNLHKHVFSHSNFIFNIFIFRNL